MMFSLCLSCLAAAISLVNLVRISVSMRRLKRREAQLQAELRRARDLWVRK